MTKTEPRLEDFLRLPRRPEDTDSDCLAKSLYLMEIGYEMVRQTFISDHPNEAPSQIRARVAEWSNRPPVLYPDSDLVLRVP